MHIGRRAGNCPAGQPGQAAPHLHILSAQVIVAVLHTGGAHGIADDDGAVFTEYPEGDAQHCRVNMETVANQFRADGGRVKNRPHNAWRTVVEAAHRVIKMCGMGDAPGKRLLRLRKIRLGMRNGDGAEPARIADQLLRPLALRRNIQQFDNAAAALVIIPESPPVRRTDIFPLLRAFAVNGEIGALHIDSGNPCAGPGMLHAVPDIIQRRADFFTGDRHCGRAERGDPLGSQVSRHPLQPLPAGIAGVHPYAGMNMDIDKAGYERTAGKVDGFAAGIHAALKVRGNFSDALAAGSQVGPDRLKTGIQNGRVF